MTTSSNKLYQTTFTILAISLFAQSHPASAEDQTTECEMIAEFSNRPYTQIKEDLKKKNKKDLQELRGLAEKCKKNSVATKTPTLSKDQSGANADNILTAMQEISVAENSLEGFNFAVGLGFIYVKANDVKTAIVDNGMLRITDAERAKLGVWLTTNTFFTKVKINWAGINENKYRWGMFVAAQIGGEEKILNSVGMGFSLASSQPSNSSLGSAPLVFQLGYGWTHIQTLAGDYKDGQALPPGATQPLFKKTTSAGPILLVSYNFN